MNGVDLTAGGGYIVYGSHDYVYAPGGQGVLSDYEGRDVLYYHYSKVTFDSLNEEGGILIESQVNKFYDPSYADDYKLLGWNFIKYINGWPVLEY